MQKNKQTKNKELKINLFDCFIQKRQLALRKAISLTLPGKSLGKVLPDKRHLDVFSQTFKVRFG